VVDQVSVGTDSGPGAQDGSQCRATDECANSALRPLETCGRCRSRGKRRNTWRCREVGSGVAGVRTVRQDDGRLLIRARRLGASEVWGVSAWLLCIHASKVAQNPMRILCSGNELAERSRRPPTERSALIHGPANSPVVPEPTAPPPATSCGQRRRTPGPQHHPAYGPLPRARLVPD
jgi:hypothetical protein